MPAQEIESAPEITPMKPGTSYCMGIEVKGAILNWKKRQLACITDDEGNSLKPRAARLWLLEELEQGHKMLPMGDCDNWDYTTGCQGHPATH
jgi:hypothetical protein